jgi:cell wall-associated NlpC family hydrolase
MKNLIDEALAWLGTPYHHEARIKGVGVDCGQFPAAVFEACELIPHVEIEPYTCDWHLHRSEERYLQIVEQFFERVEHPQPGDLALFKFGRTISHGSIVVEWPLIIHAYLPAMAVVLDDGIANKDLAPRLAGFWRLKL